MFDGKNLIAVIISIVVLSLIIDNIPTARDAIGGLLIGITVPELDLGNMRSSAEFPVSLDAGLLKGSSSIDADNIESVRARSKNISLTFDDRHITISPSILEDVVLTGYSGKLSSDTINDYLDINGWSKGISTSILELTSARNVRVAGNISSGIVELMNVEGGTIVINDASGNAVYNKTNSVSLLGDNVKINGFYGDISIGSYGIRLNGTANYMEVKSLGKTVIYG